MYHTALFAEFARLLIFFIISVLLAAAILFFSLRVTVNRPDSEKSSNYECGFPPYGDARDVFDVRFYLIAILFLIFDLETVYFFPWVVSFPHLSAEGFWFMIDFFGELLVGYVYAWKIGALAWA